MTTEDAAGGKLHVGFCEEIDEAHKLKWCWVDGVQAHEGLYLHNLKPTELQRIGLLQALTAQYPPPDIELCMEFILSYEETSHVGVVGNRNIKLSKRLIREALSLPKGIHRAPRLVKMQMVSSWFPIRHGVAKKYFANECTTKRWRCAFHVINCMLLARKRPKEVTGVLARYVMSKVEQQVLDYDWADFIQ